MNNMKNNTIRINTTFRAGRKTMQSTDLPPEIKRDLWDIMFQMEDDDAETGEYYLDVESYKAANNPDDSWDPIVVDIMDHEDFIMWEDSMPDPIRDMKTKDGDWKKITDLFKVSVFSFDDMMETLGNIWHTMLSDETCVEYDVWLISEHEIEGIDEMKERNIPDEDGYIGHVPDISVERAIGYKSIRRVNESILKKSKTAHRMLSDLAFNFELEGSYLMVDGVDVEDYFFWGCNSHTPLADFDF